MNDLHHYTVTVIWTGNTGPGTSGYADYSRAFELEAEGKHSIAGSSDPTFRGDPSRWNPEQLLIGALSACHKLWFLHLAAVSGVVVTEYVDRAEGTMRTSPGVDTGRFERVILRPEITVTAADARLADSLHAEAHRRCFIANSVNFPIFCEPRTHLETQAPLEHQPTRASRNPPSPGVSSTSPDSDAPTGRIH